MLLIFAVTLRNDARMSSSLRIRLLGMGAVFVKTTKESRSRLAERKTEDLEMKVEKGWEALRSIISFFSESES